MGVEPVLLMMMMMMIIGYLYFGPFNFILGEQAGLLKITYCLR